MLRRFLRLPSYAVVFALRPVKLFAWRTRFGFVKRLLLTLTKPIDFALILVNVQNRTMLMHERVWGGDFLFGDGLMVTDWASTDEAIRRTGFRGNDFMGVNVVASETDAFASNSGILNQSQPMRAHTRRLYDERVFTERVLSYDLERVRRECAAVLSDWRRDPAMARMTVLRSASTRMFVLLLSGVTLEEEAAKRITWSYLRRFAELSLFGRYFQFVGELLGTRKHIRKDAYLPLHALGVDPLVIDVTLFAAMFSVGTLVIRCVANAREHGIDYAALDARGRRNFVIESVRLDPTVTAVHRIVERDEVARVRGRELRLTGGDQVVYPFACSNRDAAVFPDPEALRIDRSDAEYERVLSWSKGPHACPAKELSILVTLAMLEALAERYDLRELRIFDPAF